MTILDKIVIVNHNPSTLPAVLSDDKEFMFSVVVKCNVFENYRGWKFKITRRVLPGDTMTFDYGIYHIKQDDKSYLFCFHDGGIQEIKENEFSAAVKKREIDEFNKYIKQTCDLADSYFNLINPINQSN